MNELDMNNNLFEKIKHIDTFGNEQWYARELMPLLEYNKWENFHKVIKRAMDTCKNSKINVSDHFPDLKKILIYLIIKKGVSFDTLFINIYKHSQYNYYSQYS